MTSSKHATLIDHLPGMAYRCLNDDYWTMLEVSSGATKVTGYQPEDLENNQRVRFADLIHPADRQRVWEEVQRGLNHEGQYDLEYRIIHRDGNIKEVWEHGEGIYEEGKLIELVGFLSCQAPKLQHSNYARMSQQAIVELSSSDALIEGNLFEFAKDVTRKAADILRVDRASVWLLSDDQKQLNLLCLFEKSTNSYSHDEFLLAETMPNYFSAIMSERALDVIDVNTDPRTSECVGHYLPIHAVQSLLDASIRVSGKVAGIISAEQCAYKRHWNADDINFVGELSDQLAQAIANHEHIANAQLLDESRHTKEALLKSENLFDFSPDALIQCDSDGRVIKVNQKSSQVFGYSKSEMLELNIDELVPPEYRPHHGRYRERFQASPSLRAMGDNRPFLHALHKDGSRIPVEISLAAVTTEDRVYPIASIRDVTERKKLEGSLRRAKREAEVASQKKSEFLANMSHEIRTPMNAVLGMAELLKDANLSERDREYLNLLMHSGETLLTVINDILDFAKVSEGKIELEHTPFKLRSFINNLVRPYQLEHSDKLNITARVDSDIPDNLVNDPIRLHQILNNILSNACKFTESGDVHIQADLIELDGNRATVDFQISDSGIGIAQDKINQIFNQFEQADNSTTRLFGGTGLGLAISKQLTELFDGKISVESEPDQGSSFTIRIPLTVNYDVKLHSDNKTERDVFHGMHVLLVEDNSVNVKVAGAMLDRSGVTYDVAENGQEALEQYTTNPTSYDAIFMDCDMPIMDGYEATQKIRAFEDEQQLSPIYICALTAHALTDLIERCFAVGMDKHLAKPIKPKDLELILRFFNEPRDESPG